MLFANIAIPVLFPQPLLMIIALIPVVVVETLALRSQFKFTALQIFKANLISTLWGLPLALISIAIFNFASTRGEVAFPFSIMSDEFHHAFIFPLAIAAVIIPCFILSIWIEGRYLSRRIGTVADRTFWSNVIRAHCYSYLVLLALDLLWLRFRIK